MADVICAKLYTDSKFWDWFCHNFLCSSARHHGVCRSWSSSSWVRSGPAFGISRHSAQWQQPSSRWRHQQHKPPRRHQQPQPTPRERSLLRVLKYNLRWGSPRAAVPRRWILILDGLRARRAAVFVGFIRWRESCWERGDNPNCGGRRQPTSRTPPWFRGRQCRCRRCTRYQRHKFLVPHVWPPPQSARLWRGHDKRSGGRSLSQYPGSTSVTTLLSTVQRGEQSPEPPVPSPASPPSPSCSYSEQPRHYGPYKRSLDPRTTFVSATS